jgi:threonine/homoserine/homoserine lactone efflux protein
MNFVPDPSILAQFSLATLVISVTPGPDMTLFVGRALSEGRAAGLACMFGAMAGIVIHTAVVAFGLSALLIASPRAFLALKIVGAGYLAWLAWQAIRHGAAFNPETRKRAARPLLRNWATGLGINLLNPKIILFFMTFLPQFVSTGDPHASGKLFFLGLFFIALALPITTTMVLAADRFAGLLKKSPTVTRVSDYIFAGVLGAFALKILATQRY